MKRGLIGCISVVLALAVLACAQAVAGELPSQSGASTAADPPRIQTDAGGLTAEQSLVLATIDPGGDEAYGRTSDTAEMILLYTVVAVVVVGTAILAASSGL